MPELITDREDGFLVDIGNSEQLRDVLEHIYAMDIPEKRRISEAAHEKAKMFSIERFVNALDELASDGR